MTMDSVKQRTILRATLIDAALLTVACLIPAASHLLALPLYKLNPMLMVVVAGMMLVPNRWNALLLAIIVPFATSLIAAMPTPLGALCMVCEYASVVTLFGLIARSRALGSRWAVFAAMLTAIIAGKAVYYLAKWLIVHPDQLVGTSVVWQLVSVVAIAAAVAFFGKKRD